MSECNHKYWLKCRESCMNVIYWRKKKKKNDERCKIKTDKNHDKGPEKSLE